MTRNDNRTAFGRPTARDGVQQRRPKETFVSLGVVTPKGRLTGHQKVTVIPALNDRPEAGKAPMAAELLVAVQEET